MMQKVANMIPKRFLIFSLLLFGLTCMSGGMNSMGFAIICMANQSFTEDLKGAERCGYEDFGNGSDSINTGYSAEFAWSTSLQGYIISASSWGAFIVVFTSWTIDRYGPKWIYLSCGLVSVISNILTPLAAYKSVGLLIACRVLQGTGAALSWTTLAYTTAEWASLKELGLVLGGVSSGNSLGTLLNVALAGEFCQTVGWKAIFYFWAVLTSIWCLLWMKFFSNTVNEASFQVSVTEENLIKKGKAIKSEKVKIPWRSILTSPPVWAIGVASFGGATYNYFMNDFLPTYLKKILFMPSYIDGMVSSATLLIQIASRFGFGFLSDHLKFVPLEWNLKLMSGLGIFIPGVSLFLMAFLDCTQLAAVIFCLVLGNIFLCSTNCGHMKSVVLIAPQYVSTVCMFSQGPGFLGAVLGPTILPLMMPNYAPEEWRVVFFTLCGLFTICATVWVVLGTGQRQNWAIDNTIDPVSALDHPEPVKAKVNTGYGSSNDDAEKF